MPEVTQEMMDYAIFMETYVEPVFYVLAYLVMTVGPVILLLANIVMSIVARAAGGEVSAFGITIELGLTRRSRPAFWPAGSDRMPRSWQIAIVAEQLFRTRRVL